MNRRVVLAAVTAGCVNLMGSMAQAALSPQPLTVNGDPNILVFDANKNGTIGDAGDCFVGGSGIGNTLALTMTQEPTMDAVPLRACQPCPYSSSAMYTVTGFVSPSSAEATVTDTCVPNCCGSIPLIGEFSSSTTISSTAGTAGTEVVMPLVLRSALLRDGEPPFQEMGSGFLCSDLGRPAAQVTTSGVSFLVDLSGNGGGGFTCAPIPMQRADNGRFDLIDACFPTKNGVSNLALGDTVIAEGDLNGLQSCARTAAPTASEWGLILLALTLASIGTWMLGRRPAFAAALPRP